MKILVHLLDANRQGGTFAGPSLWNSDMNVYAIDPGSDANGDRLNGSHLDMLHGSPYSMRIESAFWVFDGYNGHIAWYNFAADHGNKSRPEWNPLAHRRRGQYGDAY